jgi:uncharacterized protein (TIGR02246 family)
MKQSIFLLAIIFSGCFDPKSEEATIRGLLHDQEAAWNEGNIDAFMEGYWKSDSLKFIGKEITKGWNATLRRYKTTYPDRETMGQLKFTFYEFRFIGSDACVVTGRYQLKKATDEPTGMFTLLLRKIDGKWMIVYDHTS